jgi:hypothetical protein
VTDPFFINPSFAEIFRTSSFFGHGRHHSAWLHAESEKSWSRGPDFSIWESFPKFAQTSSFFVVDAIKRHCLLKVPKMTILSIEARILYFGRVWPKSPKLTVCVD